MTDIEKEMRIKELKSTIDVLRYECYVFNPLNLDRTALINKALDVAIRELERVIKTESEGK